MIHTNMRKCNITTGRRHHACLRGRPLREGGLRGRHRSRRSATRNTFVMQRRCHDARPRMRPTFNLCTRDDGASQQNGRSNYSRGCASGECAVRSKSRGERWWGCKSRGRRLRQAHEHDAARNMHPVPGRARWTRCHRSGAPRMPPKHKKREKGSIHVT